jgi:carbamoyltransferase
MYLGSKIISEKGIDRPNMNNFEVIELDYKQIASRLARLLADNKIVAIARGEMEFGPRALCNRSILYSAKDKSVNSWLNSKLNRTEFMPFAPVIRDIDADKFFIINKYAGAYEYMTITVPCREITVKDAPAIVHVDNTARPQIISEDSNPLMYEILSKYAEITNSGILVNTSFNMHEEPIVRTNDEAIQAFLSSDLDALLLHNTLFTKR